MPRALPVSKTLEVAAMLARDVSVNEIARQAGVTPRTILNWSKTDEAQAHIAAIRASVRDATRHLAVADKVRRINHAQEMLDGVMAVIAARRAAGAAEAMALPGEETGHVAVKTESVGGRVTKREAAFDASLHAEARKWLEYAARELSDIETGVNVRHSGRVDHVVRRPDLSALTDGELEKLAELAEKVAAGEAV
ncbi:MAG: hypothetical protein KC442_11645 [Thermomicrobiales bacterium]|nr:hypothetical protein [Thermomicrobiales bacterium]